MSTERVSVEHAPVARLGWPRMLAMGAPIGLLVGLPLAIVIAAADYPGWSELTWQLLQAATLALVPLSLAFWAMPYVYHRLFEAQFAPEKRRPLDPDMFFMARPIAIVATAMALTTVAVTLAYVAGTGEWWSFGD